MPSLRSDTLSPIEGVIDSTSHLWIFTVSSTDNITHFAIYLPKLNSGGLSGFLFRLLLQHSIHHLQDCFLFSSVFFDETEKTANHLLYL